MPSAPGRERFTCAVTPSSRSCRVLRKPLFIASAITSVATPAATPTTASSVTSRSTAGLFGDRRYRRATSQANLIGFSPGLSGCARGRRDRIHFRTQQREQNDFADRMGIGEEHGEPVDADAHARRWRQAWASARI